jgi:hypothetical protein
MLLDELKERKGYLHLKEEAIDSTAWAARFGRDWTWRETDYRMNEFVLSSHLGLLLDHVTFLIFSTPMFHAMISLVMSLPSFTAIEQHRFRHCNKQSVDTSIADIPSNIYASSNTGLTKHRTEWTYSPNQSNINVLSLLTPHSILTVRICIWHPAVMCKLKEKRGEVIPNTPLCVLLCSTRIVSASAKCHIPAR